MVGAAGGSFEDSGVLSCGVHSVSRAERAADVSLSSERSVMCFFVLSAVWEQECFSGLDVLLSPVENGGAFRGKMAARGVGDIFGIGL